MHDNACVSGQAYPNIACSSADVSLLVGHQASFPRYRRAPLSVSSVRWVAVSMSSGLPVARSELRTRLRTHQTGALNQVKSPKWNSKWCSVKILRSF